MRTSRISLGILSLACVISLLPGAALAHIGAASSDGFLSGLLHPITELDHLVTLFGLGLWVSFLGKTLAWRISVTSIAMLSFGMLLGLEGFAFPLMETLIASSLLVLGLMVVLKMRLPLLSGMAIAGLVGVLHGYAHGLEIPATSPVVSCAVGLVFASLLLQLAGYTTGSLLQRHAWAAKASGRIVAGAGIWLISGF